MTSEEDVASCPLWLDKKVLGRWLKPYYGELTVLESKVMAQDEHYLSNILRVVVRTSYGKSHHLVVKSRLNEGAAGVLTQQSDIFKKEEHIYSYTLPKLHALMQAASSDTFEPFSPRCFHSCRDFLVLEDLSQAGFRMLDRRTGLDFDHSLLVIRTLAKLHASSAVLHHKDPTSMQMFGESFFSDPAVEKKWSRYSAGMARTLAAELGTWSEEWQEYAEKILQLADTLIDQVQATSKRRDSDFNALLHGDPWVNNMMFSGTPGSVRLFDYQLAHFTSPVLDLQYFIVSSPSFDVRAKHTDLMLREYHRTLCATLELLGYAEAPPTLEELRAEYGRKALYGLWTLITPYAVFVSEPGCGFDMNQVLESGSNPGSSMYSDEYKRTVKWLLPIFESYGVFGDTQGPRPGLSTQIPPWLDKEVVQQWMRPHYGAVCVTHCEVQSVPAGGDNYMSNMHRLAVVTSDGVTRRFFIKCRMTQGYIACMLEHSDIFSKEQEMYSNTMRRLQDILHEAMPDEDNQLGPLCIHACKDFLVMEDLNTAGFRMLDRRVGLNLDQCLIVMRSLAKMHAASAVLYHRDPDSMKQYMNDFFSDPTTEERWQKYLSGMATTLAEELDTWPEDWERYAEKVRRVADCLLALLQRARARREGALNVLCHGDLWLNNILFSHRTPACRFVDFQFLQLTSPTVDVLFFLNTSPEFEVRARYTSRLVQEYHSTLCDVLRKLGWPGVLMSLDELLADYKSRAAIMLWALIEPCPLFLSDSCCEFDFDNALETGLNPGRGMYNENYRRLVKLLLPELDKMEAFDSLT